MNDDPNPQTKSGKESAKSANNGKVFDVMRPGKTPASPTSRPVIVGHKPQVQDSVVGGDPSPLDEKRAKRPLMNSAKRITIQPADEPKEEKVFEEDPPAPAEPEEPKTPEAAETTDVEDPAPAEQPEEQPPEIENSVTPEETPSQETQDDPPAEEASAPNVSESPKSPDAPPETKTEEESFSIGKAAADGAEVTDEYLAAISGEQPITTGTGSSYEASNAEPIISHHSHRIPWWEILLIIFTMIVVALIALDVLLDAGVIKVPDSVPHTEFF